MRIILKVISDVHRSQTRPLAYRLYSRTHRHGFRNCSRMLRPSRYSDTP